MHRPLKNLEAFQTEASSFVASVYPGTSAATLVTLSGELGAGKTTFVQCVAETLGITDAVTSPTFVIEKVYEIQPGRGFTHLVHIDAYRLTTGAELLKLRFNEILKDPMNLIMLEWPERVKEVLPPADVQITLQVTSEKTRTISYA